jgi:anti-sigma B factor antagonist
MDLMITESFPKDNTVILSVEGRINAITAGDLKKRIKQLVAKGYIHLILDLTGVSFIDSSGLSAIVTGLKATHEQDGSIKLVGLSKKTKHVFELTRLTRVFEFYQDVDSALLA